MHAVGLLCLMQFFPHPIPIKLDVAVMDSRTFAIPVRVASSTTYPIASLALFVSRDEGKTWTHEGDCKPSDERFIFSAPDDGLYWFAVLAIDTDGVVYPKARELKPVQKVLVNSQGKPFVYEASTTDLLHEIRRLKRAVDELESKVNRLEAGKKKQE